jgi:hypothetical protein
MGVSYRIDPRARLVFVDWGETFPSFTEIRAAIERILQDPGFARGFGVISDRRRIPAEPDQKTVRLFLSFLSRHSSDFGATRWATVTPADRPAVFGMGRMAEALSETYGVTYRVFTDYDAAVAWASERAESE